MKLCQLVSEKIYTIKFLIDLIDKWNINYRICYLVYSNYFRYPFKNKKDVEQSFVKSCIMYVIMIKIPWVIKDDKKQTMVNYNIQIKKEYQKLYYKGICQSDFKFYFLMVLLTKLISQFFADNFKDLKIDENIEGQIFIILMYVVLGIQIGPHSYRLAINKYVKKCNKKKFDSLEFGDDKTNRIYYKQLKSTAKKRFAYLYRNKSGTKFQLLIKQNEMGDFKQSQFQSQVRQNLFVQPLPEIKHNYITLREVQFAKQQKYQLRKYLKSFNLIESKMKNNSINAYQLSDSLSPTLNNQSCIVEEKFKIKMKPESNSSLYKIYQIPKLSQPKNKSSKPQTILSQQQLSIKNPTKWKVILTQLKQNIVNTQINSQKKSRRKQSLQHLKLKKIDLSNKSKNNVLPTIKHNKIQMSISESQLVQDIKLKKKNSFNRQKNSLKKISVNQLKKSFKNFLNSCSNRKYLSQAKSENV